MKIFDKEYLDESNQKLDSFLDDLLENQKVINEQLIDEISKITYTEEKQKRNNKIVLLPDNQSLENLLPLYLNYTYAAHSEDRALVQLFIKKLSLKKNEQWFTPLSQIRFEFDRINESKDFRIDPFNAYQEILNYTGTKIIGILQRKYLPDINNEPFVFSVLENYLKTKRLRIKKNEPAIQKKKDFEIEKILTDCLVLK